ncbi:Uncharacterized protein HZ326_24521 [Fusarium oxysporum f. sp. albedinis]|nr:Uncharacterized protein HZ326_24521 [Fusarium oxysporum f. sp. albedinis]
MHVKRAMEIQASLEALWHEPRKDRARNRKTINDKEEGKLGRGVQEDPNPCTRSLVRDRIEWFIKCQVP